MRIIYTIYEICIFLPVLIVSTILTSVVTILGCFIGNGHFWGYYPGKWWSVIILRTLLLPVKVTGREHLVEGQSYVFVANHQGAFDIFLIYGFLCRNFKWMMKVGLRRMPFVGPACVAAHHIFVDKSGPSKIKKTYDLARETLKHGMSLVVFPEGARTFTGHMGVFRRGAFALADELQLPVVPITINGSFDLYPRMYGFSHLPNWHRLSLTIHAPIYPESKGADNIHRMSEKSYRDIMSGLDAKYQGYVENPDQ